MQKPIFEYEFAAEKNGKKLTVQQSGFSEADARKRIRTKEPDLKIGRMNKRFKYPHQEGGAKI